MSKSERRKGQKGQDEVAAIFRAGGFQCESTPRSGAYRIKGDLYGDVPAHIEVKRQERLQLPAWLRQAAAEAPAGSLPVVAFRQNGGEWYASLPLSGLVDLLAADRGRTVFAHEECGAYWTLEGPHDEALCPNCGVWVAASSKALVTP